eukprot:TRINITY_DN13514_c0_g1_i1.p1 TRINITY_DN13514_c0_g1~~TRINITY_DN13514_c0_g1_i1.p1  ORF type:complete len:473 (-),score=106.85 TRINITY_DN13514_c0_g1_i1:124-1542(-)
MSCCFPKKSKKKTGSDEDDKKAEALKETQTSQKADDPSEVSTSSKKNQTPRKSLSGSSSAKENKASKSPRSKSSKDESEASNAESSRGRKPRSPRKKKDEGSKSTEVTPRGQKPEETTTDTASEQQKSPEVAGEAASEKSAPAEVKPTNESVEPSDPAPQIPVPSIAASDEAASSSLAVSETSESTTEQRTTKSAPATPAGVLAGKRALPRPKSIAIPMNYPQLELPDVVVPPTASGVKWTPRSPIRSAAGSRSSSINPSSRSSSLAPTPRGIVTPRSYDRSRSRGTSMSPRYTQSLGATEDPQNAPGSGAKAAADPRAAMRRMMERNTPSASPAAVGGKSNLTKGQRKELRARAVSMAATLQTLSEERENLRTKVDTEEITLDDLDVEHLGQTLAEFDELNEILPATDVDADIAATQIVQSEAEKPKEPETVEEKLEKEAHSAAAVEEGAKAIEDLVAMAADLDLGDLGDS